MSVIFHCVYSLFFLVVMLVWLQLSLEFFNVCLKIDFFLGFLGLLGHPALIVWSTFLRLIASIQDSSCNQDIFCKFLLVHWTEVVFISVKSYWRFGDCFSSIVKHRLQIVCLCWTEREYLCSFFLCFRKKKIEISLRLSIFETFFAFETIKWKKFSFSWVDFIFLCSLH